MSWQRMLNLMRPCSKVATSCAVQSAGEAVTNLYFFGGDGSEEVVAGGMRVGSGADAVKESMRLWWCEGL